MKLKAHMICHTHWDREWYLTREQFRTKLVRLIDGLLDIIDTVPEYVSFMLDGQTIVIEDYLEIKPYNKEKLFSAIKSKKIISGPWYILPDELLISGESHIRNYIQGTAVLEEIDNKMNIAYLPDSFGHPCQMPQIVEGLGMDAAVFWRGTSEEIEKTEFYWESPYSGSKILCIHMPQGYGNSANLSSDINLSMPRIGNLFESLGLKSTVDVVLMMNGSDHIVGQKNITEIVRKLNEQMPEYEIELSTMEKYLEEVMQKLPQLQTYKGEFRSGERCMLLGGTISTRVKLKQKNDLVEKKVERYLEPMISGEILIGGKYDSKGYLRYLWKKILENEPHDSICGCSIDAVHREMLMRFECIEQLEDTLMADSVNRFKDLFKTNAKIEGTQLFLFEPTKDLKPSYLEVEVAMDKMLINEVNYTLSTIEEYEDSIVHPQIPEGVVVEDEKGRSIPHVIIDAKKGYVSLYQDHTAPEIYKANILKLGLYLPGFEYGYHLLSVKKSEKKDCCLQKLEENIIENRYYKITVEDGSVVIWDKVNQVLHRNVGKLIDKGDAGDEYSYSWPENDFVCTLHKDTVSVSKEKIGDIKSSLIIEGTLILPEAISLDRKSRSKTMVSCPVKMKVSLYKDINRIDFEVGIDNQAKDHRLQIQFPSGTKADYSESYDIFHITKRKNDVLVPEKWVEYPQTTHPTHGFMSLESDDYGMVVSVNGLREFEAEKIQDETALNLTLLRSVGWLSRKDLLSRKGNGGWSIETPDAQCIGSHEFKISIAYHAKKWRETEIFSVMEKHRFPTFVKEIFGNDYISLEDRNRLNFLSQLPKEIQLSAVKPAENGNGIVIRVFNIGNENIRCKLNLPREIEKVEKVNLSEKWEKDIEINDHEIIIEIEKAQIQSFRLCSKL